MNTPGRVAVAVLIRAVVLSAGSALYGPVYDYLLYGVGDYEPIGADIGKGLLIFGIVIGVAGLWAAVDAWRKPFVEVVVTWIVVSLLFGVASAATSTWGTDAPSPTFTEILGNAPFWMGLMLVPALCGAGFAAVIRPRPAPGPPA